jgi:hypothetical protein
MKSQTSDSNSDAESIERALRVSHISHLAPLLSGSTLPSPAEPPKLVDFLDEAIWLIEVFPTPFPESDGSPSPGLASSSSQP